MIMAALLSGSAPAFAADTQTFPGVLGLTHSASSHSVRGVVKTLSSTALVIARSGKRSDLTFVLNPATSRAGAISVGATVSVRYRNEGSMLVATAVTSKAKEH